MFRFQEIENNNNNINEEEKKKQHITDKLFEIFLFISFWSQ
jgi:hypothetical protein